jgi:hypothetical protein
MVKTQKFYLNESCFWNWECPKCEEYNEEIDVHEKEIVKCAHCKCDFEIEDIL